MYVDYITCDGETEWPDPVRQGLASEKELNQ